jgi:hypothetical protein
MNFDEFSIIELEAKVKEVEPVEEKIKLIASEIRRCKRTIQDIEDEVTNIDPTDVKLITKVNCNDTTVLSILNDNMEIKKAATKELLSFCSKKCCERLRSYLVKAQTDYEYYQAELDVKVKSNCIPMTGNMNNVASSCDERIVWMCGKENLLRLFVCLLRDEYITEYSKEEILIHFANEKQIPFYQGKNHSLKIRWRKSDESFSVFTGELAKRHMIDNKNIDKICEKHFLNKDGNAFRDLAQKRYNTKNFTKTENIICKLLDSISLSIILVLNTYAIFNDLIF